MTKKLASTLLAAMALVCVGCGPEKLPQKQLPKQTAEQEYTQRKQRVDEQMKSVKERMEESSKLKRKLN